jgi:HAD superfamily hydrolase (TIGR01509 family)
MLGNWSLGDYFKEDAIKMSFDFLTANLQIPKERLAISCFAGDVNAPCDKESAELWLSLGIPKERIAFLPKKNNWWEPVGETGPCGPDTEMFLWSAKTKPPKKFDPNNESWVEIWNDVFMQYTKKRKKAILIDAVNCLFKKDDWELNKELVEMLMKTGKKVIVVSNTQNEVMDESLEQTPFEFFTQYKNPEKSNPSYFKKLLEEYHLKPEEVSYLDHKPENVKSAQSLGISAQQYKNNKEANTFIEKNIDLYTPLKQQNVDTGMGVERTLAVLNGLEDNYQSSIFQPIIKEIESLSKKQYGKNKEDTKAMRIIADHIRAAAFILGDEKAIKPSNIGQGYVLRRLIRRAIRYARLISIQSPFASKLVKAIIPIYSDYQELHRNRNFIEQQLNEEEIRFNLTLEKGLKKFEEIAQDLKTIIPGKEAFLLFQSYGFPIEMTQELADEKGLRVDLEEYNLEFQKHQDLSRTASAGMFRSGLADDSEKTRKLHTATHLLNEALRRVLSPDIRQKGSNITPERLRFDFNFPRKLTSEEIKKIEDEVNRVVVLALKVTRSEVPLGEALVSGAQSEFGAKYPELVSVYTVENKKEKTGWYSKEICTGPHVENTKDVGTFRIVKEEASAAGVRRIKAVVEN